MPGYFLVTPYRAATVATAYKQAHALASVPKTELPPMVVKESEKVRLEEMNFKGDKKTAAQAVGELFTKQRNMYDAYAKIRPKDHFLNGALDWFQRQIDQTYGFLSAGKDFAVGSINMLGELLVHPVETVSGIASGISYALGNLDETIEGIKNGLKQRYLTADSGHPGIGEGRLGFDIAALVVPIGAGGKALKGARGAKGLGGISKTIIAIDRNILASRNLNPFKTVIKDAGKVLETRGLNNPRFEIVKDMGRTLGRYELWTDKIKLSERLAALTKPQTYETTFHEIYHKFGFSNKVKIGEFGVKSNTLADRVAMAQKLEGEFSKGLGKLTQRYDKKILLNQFADTAHQKLLLGDNLVNKQMWFKGWQGNYNKLINVINSPKGHLMIDASDVPFLSEMKVISKAAAEKGLPNKIASQVDNVIQMHPNKQLIKDFNKITTEYQNIFNKVNWK